MGLSKQVLSAPWQTWRRLAPVRPCYLTAGHHQRLTPLKLLEPAGGEKIVVRARVVRSVRTLTVAAADVFAVRDGKETLCATALTTIRNFETPRPRQ